MSITCVENSAFLATADGEKVVFLYFYNLLDKDSEAMLPSHLGDSLVILELLGTALLEVNEHSTSLQQTL